MDKPGKIAECINKMFGWEVVVNPADDLVPCIPYAYTKGVEYFALQINSMHYVLACIDNCEDFRNIKRIATAVRQSTGTPVIMALDSIDSYQRRVLIDARIDFIVPDKQIYLPTIGISLMERGLGVKNAVRPELSAVATLIIIYHLTTHPLSGKSVSDIANAIGYSVKTASLAIAELVKAGLSETISEGRKKIVSFPYDRKELWNKAYPLMPSPIEEVAYTNNAEIADWGVTASDSALSAISMLQPPVKPTYAVYIRNPKLKKSDLSPIDGKCQIELWKYDPHLTSANGVVDPLSLSLTYKGDDDPRIQTMLKTIINKTL